MTDILMRGVPDEVVAAIDHKAQVAGLSRSEFLRRALVREGTSGHDVVTVASLKRFGQKFSDLADASVIDDAWS